MKIVSLTKREEELMNFLWEYGQPLASNEMLELCKEHSWSDSYLRIMLRSLEKKGAIVPCGMVRYGTQYARKFSCAFTKEEYYVQLAASRGVNAELFAKAAVAMAAQSDSKDQENLIQELEEILQDYKNKD